MIKVSLMGNIVSVSAIGQDSHRFELESEITGKKLMLGGVPISGAPPLVGNSDADVVLHALTNAVSGLTGVNILGKIADKLCNEDGITDSKVYLVKALEYLTEYKIAHVSFTIECRRPKLAQYVDSIKESIADLLSIDKTSVGLTATTGEGLTQFGKGEGIQVFVILSAYKDII